MALTNAQYDALLRIYQKKQTRARHEQNERYEKACESCPELKELDRRMAALSVDRAKRHLNGDESALAQLKDELGQLSDQKAALLSKHGFPADYLEPHYECPRCQDTGYVGSEKCVCFKKAAIGMLYTQSNIKHILEAENFDTFSFDYYSNEERDRDPVSALTPREAARRAYDETRRFVDRFGSERGNLLIYGSTGLGKTFLTHCIARELIEQAYSVIYVTAFQLFELFGKHSFRPSEDDGELYEYIFDCDLLIIDDLGTELTNSFVSSELFLCLNERLLSGRSTIISTNLSLNMLSATYSERTFSRISSKYTMLKLFGEDIRIRKKLEGK